MKTEGFAKIRNGIREHYRRGDLSPAELGLYTFLNLEADWKTGVYRGSAMGIAYCFNDAGIKRQINYLLKKLRDKKYINFPHGNGKRGGYLILINKFEPQLGELSGTRLNAWKHGDKCIPEYEVFNGQSTVSERSVNGDSTETRQRVNRDSTESERIPDLPEEKDVVPDRLSRQTKSQPDGPRPKASEASSLEAVAPNPVQEQSQKLPRAIPGDETLEQVLAAVDEAFYFLENPENGWNDGKELYQRPEYDEEDLKPVYASKYTRGDIARAQLLKLREWLTNDCVVNEQNADAWSNLWVTSRQGRVLYATEVLDSWLSNNKTGWDSRTEDCMEVLHEITAQ